MADHVIPSAKQIKLAQFISMWTARRLSDVIRAIEDRRSREISAWTTEAEDNLAVWRTAEKRFNEEIDKRVADATEWDNKRKEFMERVGARLRVLSNSIDGPLYRKATRDPWLTERGWILTPYNTCKKNGYSCKAHDAPTMEIVWQLEEADGKHGEYQKLYTTDFYARLEENGIVQSAEGYTFADPEEAEVFLCPPAWPGTDSPAAPH